MRPRAWIRDDSHALAAFFSFLSFCNTKRSCIMYAQSCTTVHRARDLALDGLPVTAWQHGVFAIAHDNTLRTSARAATNRWHERPFDGMRS